MRRWKSQPLRQAISHYWRYNREIARQVARHGDRIVMLRYEELMRRPELVLRELLEWLGEPWSDRVLQHDATHGSRAGRTRVEGRTRVDQPISADRADRWTTALDEASRRTIARRLGRLGEFFGYSMSDPSALEPIGAGDRFLITSTDVRARIARFADLDLGTRHNVPLPSATITPGTSSSCARARRRRPLGPFTSASPGACRQPLRAGCARRPRVKRAASESHRR